MHYYKCKIQYNGTHYAGFQWQNELQTVQGDINNALSKLLTGKFSTSAASRTDTGVHALDQVLKITCENLLDANLFLPIFNNELPSTINCFEMNSCEGLFRPSTAAYSKEYRYFFTNKKQTTSDANKFIANISNELNLDKIKACLDVLIGDHDFCNFYSSGSNVKSTRRNIAKCELTIINPHDLFSENNLFQIPITVTDCFELRIEANGFLKQMIRHIVSALWMVGSGKISVDEFKTLLNGSKTDKQWWKVAPANGLFLYKIKSINNPAE